MEGETGSRAIGRRRWGGGNGMGRREWVMGKGQWRGRAKRCHKHIGMRLQFFFLTLLTRATPGSPARAMRKRMLRGWQGPKAGRGVGSGR